MPCFFFPIGDVKPPKTAPGGWLGPVPPLFHSREDMVVDFSYLEYATGRLSPDPGPSPPVLHGESLAPNLARTDDADPYRYSKI